jgi:hypothetical protein
VLNAGYLEGHVGMTAIRPDALKKLLVNDLGSRSTMRTAV